MKNGIFTCLFIFLCFGRLSAQDIHFSQFYHSPQNLNPALIGIFRGDYRATGNLRSQWSAVPVPYQTFGGGGDGKLLKNVLGGGLLSGGLQFNYDRAGDLAVQLTEVGLGGSLAYRMTDGVTGSAGLRVAFANRNLDASRITTAAQFNGDVFNENAGSGENIPQTGFSYLNLSAGANAHFHPDKNSRTTGDFGIALYNINYPNAAFKSQNTEVNRPLRLSFYINTWVQVHPAIDVKGHGLWHVQGDFGSDTYTEAVFGTGVRYHLSLDRDKEKSVAFLTSYRLGDALIPSVEIGWRMFTAAFSYDFNTSPFQTATNRRGGPEFSLIYIFTKPVPPPEFKACPVF